MPRWRYIKSNLVCNNHSGVYSARVRVKRGSKSLSLWKSLRTTSRTVADQRLAGAIAAIKASKGAVKRDANLTLGECKAIYLNDVRLNKELKPRAINYRVHTFVGICGTEKAIATFPDFDETRAETVTWEMCDDWARRARQRYSGPRFNGMLQSFRAVLDIAVRMGCLDKNPFRDPRFAKIKHAKVFTKNQTVYTFEQLDLLFAELKRRSVEANQFCRFLYHFTLRVETASSLKPYMVNRAQQQFEIPGEIVKGERKGTIIYAPIFQEMAALLDELDVMYGKDREWVLPIQGCIKTLHRAHTHLNLPYMTHHLFRHNFASHALMKGVNPVIVAGWLNHKDGGALLLKRYSHIINSFSRDAAATLVLRNTPEEKIHVLAEAVK